jgi:hypothetical protein
MSVTFNDILEKLKQMDEVSLLELLDLRSEDIVDRFMDHIEDMVEKLEKELE